MWGGNQQFNFQENSGGMSGAGATSEFSFVGQDGGSVANDAQAEAAANYPMEPMQQQMPMQNPYGPPAGQAYGPGYGGMGAPAPYAAPPTFLGNVVKGAVVGGVILGALSYFTRSKKKRKR